MKILLASQAIAGHFNPMTGMARRLKDRGHEVGFYTGKVFAGKLTQLGVRHFPFDRAIEHTADNLNELYPERAKLKGPAAIRFDGERIFASNVSNFFEDIRDVQKEFPFETVVMDSSMFVQRPVSALLGKPVISFVAIGNMESDPLVPPLFFGFSPAKTLRQKVLHQLARLASNQVVLRPARLSYIRQLEHYGLQGVQRGPISDEPYRWSEAVIQTGTASIDFPRRNINPKVRYVGALLPYRAAEDGATATIPIGRYAHTVVVTQGTVDNKDPNKLMVPAIEALKDRDVLIVVATGGVGTEELSRRYPLENVLVKDFVDFDQPFPLADVFITNGGFGGVLLSLSHGVPVVAAGINEGKSDVNARLEYAGAGINFRTERPTPLAIAKGVDTIITNPNWRTRAQAIRQQFEAEDGVGAAVEIIEGVAWAASKPGSAPS